MFLQRMLGQVLLNPPNVAGWKEGYAWIDSSSLMLRLKLPSALLNKGNLDWDEPGESAGDLDKMTGPAGDAPMRDADGRLFRVAPDKAAFLAQLDPAATDDALFGSLLQVDASHTLRANIGKGELMERVLEILSSPEYQLC